MFNLKKLIPITLAFTMMVPVAASAATTDSAQSSQRAAYAGQIKEIRQTIKSNEEANQALRSSIKTKLQQIKAGIKADRANKTLKDKKDALKAQRAVIKQDNEQLKAINVNLKADQGKVKTDKSNKDFADLVTDLNAIPSLQTSKTAALQKLSTDLDAMLNILSGSTAAN